MLAVVIALICASVFVACNKDAQTQGARVAIRFDANDGSEIKAQSVDPDNITYVPDARVGYDFVCWTMDKDGNEPLDSSKIKLGTTLYAQWKIKTFTVNFYCGEDIVKTATVEYGQAATAPTDEEIALLLKEDETFEGWDADFSKVTSNRSVYANIKKAEKEYTVNFVVGNETLKSIKGTAGNAIVLPSQSEIEEKIPAGFVFEKWVDEQGNEIASDAKIARDVTYTAKFTLATPTASMVTVLYPQGKTAFVYGDTCSASIEKETAPDGVTYTYEWFDAKGNKLDSQDGSICSIENLNVGEVRIASKVTASADGYTSVSATSHATIKVEKATLTVTIDKINIVYGRDLPTCALRFDGFKYRDGESVVDKTELVVSTSYQKGSDVGAYALSISGLKANNYSFVGAGENGAIATSVIVGKRALSLKDGIALEKSYDGSPYSKTLVSADFAELASGDEATLVVSTRTSSVGTYPDADSVLDADLTIVNKDGKVVTNNYAFENNLTVTINPATIKYTPPQDTSFTFDGKEHRVDIVQTETEGCDVSYRYNLNDARASSLSAIRNAGVYTVYYTISRQNYTSVEGSFTVTVEKANATIKATPQSTIYGQAFLLDQSAYTATDLFGETINVTLSCTYAVGSAAKDYEIILTADENDNIKITCENGILSVGKANLVAKINEKTITYGGDFTPSFDIITVSEGLYSGDNIADLLALATTYRKGDNAGTYKGAITATLKESASANYTLSCTSGDLVVDKKQVSLIVDGKTVTYGDPAPEYTATIEGLFGDDTIEYTLSSYYKVGDGVRKYFISADYPEMSETKQNGNYYINVNSDNAYVEVNKKHIAVTFDSLSVTYGDPAPTLGYTTDKDFVGDDIPTIGIETTYTQGAKVGSYKIKLRSCVDNGNYDFEYIDGTLTVGKRDIAIEYENHNFAYNGGEKASFSVADCVKGAFDGDVFGGTLQTASGEIGTYKASGEIGNQFVFTAALTITNKAGENVADCYNVAYDLSVEIKQITIQHTVHNLVNQVYDGEAHTVYVEVEEGTNVVYVVNGQEQTTNPSFVDADEYSVTFRLTKDGSTPYEGNFTAKIAKRAATATADGQSAVFNEVFTFDTNAYTLDGVLEKDTSDVVVTLACDYKVGNDKGSYLVTVEATHKNYDFTSVNGTLTVGARNIVIDEKTYRVTYGDDAPELVGFTSQSVAVALDFVTLSTTYAKGNFGVYNVTATSSNANYTVDSSALKLVVDKKNLSLSFDTTSLTTTYGEQIDVAYIANGLLAKDKGGVAIQYNDGGTWSNVPEILGAGAYDVRITLASSIADRYNISADSVQNGTLTVQKAPLNIGIDANSLSIVFGEDAAFVPVYSGFVNDEDSSVLQGTLAFACDYTTQKHAGVFAVTMSGLLSNNYDIAYATDAKLNVAKASVTITAKPQNTVYGQAFSLDTSAFEISHAEELNGYATAAISSIAVSLSCDYTVGDNAATYEIVLSATHDDFAITTINGTLTVEKANYTAEYVNAEIAKIDLKGTYTPGMHLEAYALPAGFAWSNPTTTPTCDNTAGYDVTFCADKTNYNVFKGAKVKIKLAKASPNLRLDGTLEYDWTGNAIDYVADTRAKLKSSNTDDGFSISVIIKAPSGMSEVKDGGVYTLTATIPETTNYIAQSLDVTLKVKAATVGSVNYTVEDAVAQGGTATLFGNAFVANDLTIPSGTTLILPSDNDSNDALPKNLTSLYGSGATTFVDNNSAYIKIVLTVLDSTTVTVQGKILVRGLLGAAGGILEGHTSGSHSQLINNGTINFNSGSILAARGYIKGTGTANFNSGSTVYSPFVVLDFRGGTNTTTVFRKGNIAPFSQYEMPNIQCAQYYRYGAKHTAYVDLYASKKHNSDSVTAIGAGGIIEVKDNGSYVKKTYSNRKSTLTIIGNAIIGDLSLSVSGITVKMSDVQFPIPWTYDINIGDGITTSSLTAAYDYKVLTGANIVVNSNATLTTNKSIIIYSTFTDTSFGGAVYPNKPAASLVVNGIFNINGAFGGNIQSSQSGAKVCVASSAGLSVSSSEGNSGDTSQPAALINAGTFFYTSKYVETARFGAGSCTITDETFTTGIWPNKKTHHYNQYTYTGGTALEKGKTYTYNGTSWNAA